LPALQALVLKLHPYELPALFVLPAQAATAPYAQWVARETDGAEDAAG
jgi:uncharacterized protein involved in tolerance to divalent cations